MTDTRTADLDAVVRTARIVHGAMLVSLFFYAALAEYVKPSANGEPAILYALGAVALGSAVALIVVRMRLVGPAAERIGTMPDDTAARQRWMLGNIISFALAESIGLYGFVARFLGAPLSTAVVFYAAAVVLMIYSTPRRP